MSTKLEDIQDDLKAAVLKNFMQGQSEILKRIIGPQRRGHRERDAELTEKFHEFKERWESLLSEGFETGFLESTYDEYELAEPYGRWVYDETEEEFQQRLKRESCEIGNGGHVVFSVAKGPRP